MSDRCYFEIVLRKEDLAKAEEILGNEFMVDGIGLPQGLVTAVDQESDGGYWNERPKLAKEGVVFWGHHGAGDNYGPCALVGIDGREHEAPVDHAGQPVVRLHENGRLVAQDLRKGREYLRALRRATKEMIGPPTPAPQKSKGRASGR